MKAVYIKTTTIEITLTNGQTIFKNDYKPSDFTRSLYQYGEVPNEKIIEFDNSYEPLDNLALLMLKPIYQTLFKKRSYIYDYDNEDRLYRIYEDTIKSFVVKNNYKIITNPSINRLQSDLDFYTYSQLVFDRERELKGMLNKGD